MYVLPFARLIGEPPVHVLEHPPTTGGGGAQVHAME
jgi:hypothetical protein